jgi:hypothetical protein
MPSASAAQAKAAGSDSTVASSSGQRARRRPRPVRPAGAPANSPSGRSRRATRRCRARRGSVAPVAPRRRRAASKAFSRRHNSGASQRATTSSQGARSSRARAGRVVHQAGVERRFQALRIAVAADRQRRTGELQQVQQGRRVHAGSSCEVRGAVDLLAQRHRRQRMRVVLVAVMVAAAIGARFRLERRLLLTPARPVRSPSPSAPDRRGCAASPAPTWAWVCRLPRWKAQRASRRIAQRTGRSARARDDAHHAAIVAAQQVAVAQHRAARAQQQRTSSPEVSARAGGSVRAGRRAAPVRRPPAAAIDQGMQGQHGQTSEQEIALRQRQHGRRFAGHQQAPSARTS